jgi:hypothetical protein
MAQEPDRDLSEAFPVDKVTAAAEKLLHHDRFDADLLVSEVESDSDEDSSSNEPSDSTKDSESSESGKEFFPKKQVKKGRHKEKVRSKPKKEKSTPTYRYQQSQEHISGTYE